MASKQQTFRAQLVLEDETSAVYKLKRSKRHGELVLDGNTQSAQMVYPRLRRFFTRKFQQPLKCVVGRRLLRVYSSNGNKSFTCRLLSDEDVEKCIDSLRTFGVQVINVGEAMLSSSENDRRLRISENALTAGCEAVLRTIRESPMESTCADIRAYEFSTELQEDTEAIMRAMFST